MAKTSSLRAGVESCALVSFTRATVAGTKVKSLVVEGTAPCLNMKISLLPRIYIDCPTHWGIEVVGCLPGGLCLPAIKKFKVTIKLRGIVGSKGIEVIGANKSKKMKVAGGCSPVDSTRKIAGGGGDFPWPGV